MLWNDIEVQKGYIALDYSDRLYIRKQYFDNNIASYDDLTNSDDSIKIKFCIEWLSEELNNEDFNDWKRKNDKLQRKYQKKADKVTKKRDKCLIRAAKDGRTREGLKFLQRDCYKKYPSPERKTHSKENYKISAKETAEIRDYCKNRYHKIIPAPTIQPTVKVERERRYRQEQERVMLEQAHQATRDRLYRQEQARQAIRLKREHLYRQEQERRVRQKQARLTIRLKTIEAAHKNSQKTLSSKELRSWVLSRPTTTRDAYINIYNNGTTTEVIKMLDDFVAYKHHLSLNKKWADDITRSIKEGIDKQ